MEFSPIFRAYRSACCVHFGGLRGRGAISRCPPPRCTYSPVADTSFDPACHPVPPLGPGRRPPPGLVPYDLISSYLAGPWPGPRSAHTAPGGVRGTPRRVTGVNLVTTWWHSPWLRLCCGWLRLVPAGVLPLDAIGRAASGRLFKCSPGPAYRAYRDALRGARRSRVGPRESRRRHAARRACRRTLAPPAPPGGPGGQLLLFLLSLLPQRPRPPTRPPCREPYRRPDRCGKVCT